MTKRALTGKAVLAGTGEGKAPGGRAVAEARLLAQEGSDKGRRPRRAEVAGTGAEAEQAAAGKAKDELGATVIKCLSKIVHWLLSSPT